MLEAVELLQPWVVELLVVVVVVEGMLGAEVVELLAETLTTLEMKLVLSRRDNTRGTGSMPRSPCNTMNLVAISQA